jgi:hypothetical protein
VLEFGGVARVARPRVVGRLEGGIEIDVQSGSSELVGDGAAVVGDVKMGDAVLVEMLGRGIEVEIEIKVLSAPRELVGATASEAREVNMLPGGAVEIAVSARKEEVVASWARDAGIMSN